MDKRSSNPAVWFTGMMIGGLVGAGVALLTAPRSGEETRAMIREKSIEMKDQAVKSIEETRERAGELAQTGKERVAEMTKRGQEAIAEKSNGAKKIFSGLKEGIGAAAKQSEVDTPAGLPKAEISH